MLRSDSHIQNSARRSSNNLNSVTVDVVKQIETELETCDVASLMFLLNDDPDAALRELVLLERVSGDTNMGLLSDWASAMHVQGDLTWRIKFLEALTVCQLNGIIRKMEFDINYIQNHLLLFGNYYIIPIKKVLYKLCESVTSDNLEKLQKTLLKNYRIDTTGYTNCELILLELMCKRLIIVKPNGKYYIDKLLIIIHSNFPDLYHFVKELTEVRVRFNNGPMLDELYNNYDISDKDGYESDIEDCDDNYLTASDRVNLVKSLGICDNIPVQNFEHDSMKQDSSVYPIKNPDKLGICYIISQEEFYPSRESIENNTPFEIPENRLGSSRDVEKLKETMSSFNFTVIPADKNIDHINMMRRIKEVIWKDVDPDDSVFMLCILSHGVLGHVYAADSVKVKIDAIRNLVDLNFHERKLDLAKLMIIQACQEYDETNDYTPDLFIGDPLAKYDCGIYYSAAPETLAYSDKLLGLGGVFIGKLCEILKLYAHEEHLDEMFTRVRHEIKRFCIRWNQCHEADKHMTQVPIFNSTLTKKLYLKSQNTQIM